MSGCAGTPSRVLRNAQPKDEKTGEDYRWAILRSRIRGRVRFELFNFFFISLFQLCVILLFTLPLHFVGLSDKPLTALDLALFTAQTLLLVFETVADNQQFAFHARKNDPACAAEPRLRLGFNTLGVWNWCRHPNYFGELGQWLVVWLYAVSATGALHWSGIGILLLLAIFTGSTIMTESITASKYPAYAAWKRATPAWVPAIGLLWRGKARQRFRQLLTATDG